MSERLQFLVVYIGSAAMVAFLAACLTAPRVSTFTCTSSSAAANRPCELADTLAAAAAAPAPAVVT